VSLDIFIVILYSYLIGSIPTGLILTQIFLKKDIRKFGSGNIGATNVLRTGKKSLAFTTLLIDIFKGYSSIFISSIYFNDLVILAGLICFLGHIFPVWLKFKGGKGIATYVGILLGLSIELFLVFGFLWLVFLFLFRYSSLSSITGSLLTLIYSINLGSIETVFLCFFFFIIIIFTHKENIVRLKNKKETKIKF
tara:strand:- start:393 stop:974 length:582 start_codon:yes stop_codon:yes gene_type:complete